MARSVVSSRNNARQDIASLLQIRAQRVTCTGSPQSHNTDSPDATSRPLHVLYVHPSHMYSGLPNSNFPSYMYETPAAYRTPYGGCALTRTSSLSARLARLNMGVIGMTDVRDASHHWWLSESEKLQVSERTEQEKASGPANADSDRPALINIGSVPFFS